MIAMAAIAGLQAGMLEGKMREDMLAKMSPQEKQDFFYQERTRAIQRLAVAQEEANATNNRGSFSLGSAALGFIVGTAID